MAETWLRVATYATDRAGVEGTLAYLETSVRDVVRRLKGQSGFRAGHWGHDPESGTVAAVTHWASRTAIENAAPEFAAIAADRAAHGIRATGSMNLCLFTSPTTWDSDDWAAVTGGNAANWLRVVLYRPENAGDAECVDYLRSSTRQALEMLHRQPGFRTGYWGHDPVAGTMAAVTYWDSLDAITNASAELERLHRERKEHGVATEAVANLQLFRVPGTTDQEPQGWLS